MLKFFRRYRNWILAVGGSILMVAFLLGSVISQLGQLAPSPTLARIVVNGKSRKIKLTDQYRAATEVDMFKQALGPIIETLLDPLGEFDDGDPDTTALQGSLHWYLLKIQAEEAGLQGGVGDAENYIWREATQLAIFDPSLNGNIDLAYQQVMNRLLSRSGRLNSRETLLAVADFLAVQRLINTYHGSSTPSDYRLQTFGREFLDGVTVATTLVDAAYFIEDEPEPSEEAQQAQFAKYADVLPGEGEFGIGYRLPDRVQFEYFTIGFDSILDSIEVSPLDANLWFKDNLERIQATSVQIDPVTFENSRDQAVLALRTEKAEARMDEIINAIKAKLLRSSRGLTRDGDYRTLPEDWISQRISFADLQQEIQNEFGVNISYLAIGDRWVPIQSPTDVGDIALAQRAAGSQFLSLGEVLKSYRAFGNPDIAGLQSGLADIEPYRARSFFPVLGRDRRSPSWGDAIFMRVTAIDPARAAATLDEVKPDVVRDLKRIAVYERLKTEQADYLTRANTEGVRKIAEELGGRTDGGQIVNIDSIALGRGSGFVPSSIRTFGEDQEFAQAILAKGRTITEVGDITSLPREQRTIVAPIPGKLGLGIAVIERKSPMTRERLQSHLGRQFSYKRTADLNTSRYGFADVYAAYELNNEVPGDNPFSFEALCKRYQFEEEEENMTPADDDETTTDGLGGDSDTKENAENSNSTNEG